MHYMTVVSLEMSDEPENSIFTNKVMLSCTQMQLIGGQ